MRPQDITKTIWVWQNIRFTPKKMLFDCQNDDEPMDLGFSRLPSFTLFSDKAIELLSDFPSCPLLRSPAFGLAQIGPGKNFEASP